MLETSLSTTKPIDTLLDFHGLCRGSAAIKSCSFSGTGGECAPRYEMFRIESICKVSSIFFLGSGENLFPNSSGILDPYWKLIDRY